MVPTENATNLMDSKEIERNSVTRNRYNKIAHRIRTRLVIFFGHLMRKEKLEYLVTTGTIEGKRSRGK